MGIQAYVYTYIERAVQEKIQEGKVYFIVYNPIRKLFYLKMLPLDQL